MCRSVSKCTYQRLRQRGKQPLVKEHKSACGSASLGPRKKWQTWPKNLNGAQRSKGERAFLNSGTDLKTHFRNTIEDESKHLHPCPTAPLTWREAFPWNLSRFSPMSSACSPGRRPAQPFLLSASRRKFGSQRPVKLTSSQSCLLPQRRWSSRHQRERARP